MHEFDLNTFIIDVTHLSPDIILQNPTLIIKYFLLLRGG